MRAGKILPGTGFLPLKRGGRVGVGTLLATLLLSALCPAAEKAAEVSGPLEIHRTPAELAVIVAGLLLLWVLALGTATVLWMRAREADRLHDMRRE